MQNFQNFFAWLKSKTFFIVLFSFLFFGSLATLVYGYKLMSIPPCSQDNSGVCFDVQDLEGKKEALIKKLDSGKKYRLVIKQKKGDSLVELTNAVIDTSNKNNPKYSNDNICKDSDGGRNFYKKGTVNWPLQNFNRTDVCNGDVLKEYYCEDENKGMETEHRCPYGCSDGRCKNASVNSITLKAGKNGRLVWVVDGSSPRGYKVVWSKNQDPTYPTRPGDKYRYISSPDVNEYIIEPFLGSGVYYARVCEYLGGKCGVYSNEVSVSFQGVGDANDFCYDTNTAIFEQNAKCCDNFTLKKDIWSWRSAEPMYVCCNSDQCAGDGVCFDNGEVIQNPDKKCVNGVWKNNSNNIKECVDTDNGKNYYQKGTVDWPLQGFIQEDYCNGDVLIEGYCEDDKGMTERHTCENGCQDGKCVGGL